MRIRICWIITTIFILTLSINVFASEKIDVAGITNKKLNGISTTQYEDCGASAPALNSVIVSANNTAYIIIGDSRAVQLDLYNSINSTQNEYVVFGASGEGYDYMVNIALPAAQKLEDAHPEIKHWKYIITLGLNDLENLNNYKNKLSTLGLTKDIVFVSVNPVEDSNHTNELLVDYNKNIHKFNKLMENTPNIKYYDTNTYLEQVGFGTVDNIHYNGVTLANLYTLIRGCK